MKSLRKWLFIHDMTIQEFSERVGIHRTYAYMIMKGKKRPSLSILMRIQEVTGQKFTRRQLVDVGIRKDVKRSIFSTCGES